jgi:hypothetical protein
MKKQIAKHFFLLSVPTALLAGLGFMRPDKPILRVQSVQVRRATSAEVIGRPQGVIAVEVLIEYHNPSLVSRLTEEHWLLIDKQHGAYVEDEHGNKYGYSTTAPDRNTWRRIGIGNYAIDDNPMKGLWILHLSRIPKSAGKLTFKTVLNLDEADASKASAHLPISVVVRE